MKRSPKPKRFYPFWLASLTLLWSLVGGWGISWAIDSSVNVPSNYQAGMKTYLESCAGCHVPLPPEVMPTEAWKKILERPQDHYGTSLPLIRVTQVVIWQYLNFFSRPLGKNEPLPRYVTESRYFKALHPNVDLPKPTTHHTCLSCHSQALNYDYRTLKD